MRNRLKVPVKHILVLEDVLKNQSRIATHFAEIFEDQGEVEVSYISGGNYAKELIVKGLVNLIILDHDMPNGEGDEFLKFMNDSGSNIPVITFSGIHSNNQHLMDLGAKYGFDKEAVISGLADEIIFKELGL